MLTTSKRNNAGSSILFQPHRTVGLITTSRPFSLTSGSTSHRDTFLTVPLHERFVIYKCDALQPVMVSDALCSSTFGTTKSKTSNATEEMLYAVSDNSLSITVAIHKRKGNWKTNGPSATLYKRNKVIEQLSILPKEQEDKQDWSIVHVINLGRSKFDCGKEKRNRDESTTTNTPIMENCMMIAILLAKNDFESMSEEQNGVKILENLEDEDEDDHNTNDDDGSSQTSDSTTSYHSNSSSSSNTTASGSSRGMVTDPSHQSRGEIVIVLASRNKLYIQQRLPLTMIPDFSPSIAMHPHTYLNKIVIGGQDGRLIMVNIRSGKLIHEFKCLKDAFSTSNGTFSRITVLEQSPAVDTIAVGTYNGKVHLINLRVDMKLFTLDHNQSPITALSFRTDALALEHNVAPLAVGQKNGSISVWDLNPRSDEDDIGERRLKTSMKKGRRTLLCQMEKVHPGGVSTLTYLPQEPLLLSAGCKSNKIVMHIFDNPNHSGRVLRERVGHVAPPSLIRYQYPSNGGTLASMADGTDAAACQILSCGSEGDNSLRVFSTARSVLDREYSQGKGLEKKARDLRLESGKADLLLKEIIGIAHCESKSRDWGNLVTIHKDHALAYVWSTKTKSQSGPVLKQENWNVSAMQVQPPKSCHATSIALSACGNFAVVGTKGGVIYKYNLQSGLPRGSFPRDATDDVQKNGKNAKLAGNINRTTKMLEKTLKVHKLTNEDVDETVLRNKEILQERLKYARHIDSSVVGLAVDTLNRTLLSVGSDSKLILWSFTTHAPHRNTPITLSSPATKLVHAQDSDLLALALEDYSIVLFDFSRLNIVRRFGIIGSKSCHAAPISDVAFGPDGRKLYSSSYDGTLRVWDVPTNTCVDWLSFASPPTSLSLSATGEFLATSHQGRLGISLWCDKSFFQTVHLDGAHPPSKPFFMDEPASIAEVEDILSLSIRAANDSKVIADSNKPNMKQDLEEEEDGKSVVVPKREGLITLSGLPAAHWKNLFHLELVKERNKPTEAPKKPPSAPFFLQWRAENASSEVNDSLKDNEWNAIWSDDDDNGQDNIDIVGSITDEEKQVSKRLISTTEPSKSKVYIADAKRQKVKHFRSELASLLERCSLSDDFEPITEYLATKGPSSIDVSFSNLCHGMHDLEEGLEYLYFCAKWLLHASRSRKSFEAINAYMHRFLHIHANTIAGIEVLTNNKSSMQPMHDADTKKKEELLHILRELKISHQSATESLRCKMQETICLLRHFSRMV